MGAQQQDYGPAMRQRSTGIGKKPILGLLVVSILLIAIGGIWLSIASVPNYDKLNSQDSSDYQEKYTRGLYSAQTFAGILASIGCVLGSVISLYGGMMSSMFSEDQKKAMLILAGIFALGLVLVINHYPWFGSVYSV